MFQFSTPPPLSLYIHLPWCVQKCPYCDFNSHALRGELPERVYITALLRDLDLDVRGLGARPLTSVFLGGGTPSLFSPAAIQRLLDGVRQRLELEPGAEITLEANPGTVEQARFEGFRAAGVTRLSIGVQSFDAAQLRKLGRIHDRDEALRAAHAARAAGFDNFNLDLMYGLPGQDVDGALADLQQAIALTPAHLSHYQLTLEPNTLFHAHPPVLPGDDSLYEMQMACQALLRDEGYRQYEVSAYARPGRECRHNLNYWSFGDYLAIGAGAHGKISDPSSGQIRRYWKQKNPRDYQAHAGSEQAIGGRQTLEVPDVVLEFMMNALRLNAGFTIPLCEQRTGLPWRAFEPLVERAAQRGWLELAGNRVFPTEQGRLYLNELLQIFLPEMP